MTATGSVQTPAIYLVGGTSGYTPVPNTGSVNLTTTHGTVTFYADGSFDYTPDSSSAPVSDSFTYVLTGAPGAPALTDNRATVTLDFQNANTVRVDHYALAEDGAKLKFTVHLDRAAGDTATVTVPYSVTRDSYNNLTGGASSNGGFATGVLTFSGSDSSHDVEITVPDDIDVGNDIFEFQLLSNEDLTYAGIDSDNSLAIATAAHEQMVSIIDFNQIDGVGQTTPRDDNQANSDLSALLNFNLSTTATGYDTTFKETTETITAFGGSGTVDFAKWNAIIGGIPPVQTGSLITSNSEQLKGKTLTVDDPLIYAAGLSGSQYSIIGRDMVGLAQSPQEILQQSITDDLSISVTKNFADTSSTFEHLPDYPLIRIPGGITIPVSELNRVNQAKQITYPVAEQAHELQQLEKQAQQLQFILGEQYLVSNVPLPNPFKDQWKSELANIQKKIETQTAIVRQAETDAYSAWMRAGFANSASSRPIVGFDHNFVRRPTTFLELVDPANFDSYYFIDRDASIPLQAIEIALALIPGFSAAQGVVAGAADTAVIGEIEGLSASTKSVDIFTEGEIIGSGDVGAPSNLASEPNRIYSARELFRRAEDTGPYHNFPESFNESIFQGNRQVISNNYTVYTKPGTLNGPSGECQIGARTSASGRTEVIIHRFFRPDK